MWSSVGLVTSGFSLLAFIVAAIVICYRYKLANQQKTLSRVTGDDLKNIIDSIVDMPSIDTSNLKPSQHYQLAMELLTQRRKRLYMQTILLFVFGLLFFIIAFVTIIKDNIPSIIKQWVDEKIDQKKSQSSNNSNLNNSAPGMSPITIAPFVNAKSEGQGETLPLNVAIVNEPATVKEYLSRIKTEKNKKEKNELAIKARALIAPDFNFDYFEYQKEYINARHDDLFKFISYDSKANKLNMHILSKYYSVGLAGRPKYFLTGEYEADVSISINNVDMITTNSVTDSDGYVIACYIDIQRKCIEYSNITKGCPISGEFGPNSCPSLDSRLYIYDATSPQARKLKSALKNAIKINKAL